MEYPNLVGTPHDYSKKKNWMVLPKKPKKPKKAVDCIWLYPTSCMSRSLIGDVNAVMKFLANDNYKRNGPIFEKHCNVYAPYYHQLSAQKFNDLTDQEIYDVEANEPRTDVYAALDYYFEHYNNGRPYILAGHSQGACLIVYVLTEYMKLHPEYYDRMVDAYCVGFGMSAEQLAENPHIKPAAGPDDTGVFLSWNTEGPENVGQHNFVIVPNAYIINPLNWKTDDTPAKATPENKALADARIDLSRRSIIATGDLDQYTLQNEMLAMAGPLGKLPPVKKLAHNMMVPGFGDQCYHNNDYVFFADSVEKNLQHRIENYLKK
ncbi:MAG: DUF3089 domain-containing protein [Clostridia bacterium]|nr:DUF3089 domain-containing protein [Clostridia bacterium]